MRYWIDNEDDLIAISRPPIHPGEILREEYMPDYGLSVASLSKLLGVSRQTINEIVHERRDLSFDMCLRLARLFHTSPDLWLNLQRDVNMWNSMQLHSDEIKAIQPISASVA